MAILELQRNLSGTIISCVMSLVDESLLAHCLTVKTSRASELARVQSP